MSYLKLLVVVLAIGLGGCATTEYTTHYGIFSAENSAGELRQFRLHWQTLRYEGWTGEEFRSMPVVLETQCSKRKLLFFDSSFGKGRRCSDNTGEGIVYCGDSRRDMDRRALPIEHKITCGTVTDRSGSNRILDLEGEILLTLNCRPQKTTRPGKEKKQNIDYLLNSSLPYVVATKKIEGQGKNIDLFVPEISNHSSICDPDS